MTEEEGNAAVIELMADIRKRHPILANLAGAWRTAYGHWGSDAFMQGVVMGYKAAWDDQHSGAWAHEKKVG